MEAGPPHEALFLALPYLPVNELLSTTEVCISLRNAVNKDVLTWLNIVVDQPLNSKLSDEILMKISLKANGKMRSLCLMNCVKITDDGIQWVIEKNPLIHKLHLPGCTGLTPEGVIRAVKTLSEHGCGVKSLRINGIYNIQNEHLKTLYLLVSSSSSQELQKQPPIYYGSGKFPAIDVGICPRCSEVKLVFDCPRDICRKKREQSLPECRGCSLCIPRCEECGGCVEFENLEEPVCPDILCTDCWLRLPKCNFCNKPYCKRHAYQQCSSTSSLGFICHVCHEKYITNL